LRTHVYDKICKQIETLTTNDQNRNILFLIFSELLQGNELGLDYLVKQFGIYGKNRVGRSSIQRMLMLLTDQGLIKVDIWGNRFDHRANHYVPTATGHDLIRTSTKAYWSFGDFKRSRNTARVGDSIFTEGTWSEYQPFVHDWLNFLPNNPETHSFIEGLLHLESNDLYFNRLKALQMKGAPQRLRQLKNIPNNRFRAHYRPLRSGRLQSVPHMFIGKELVPFILPANDPYLSDGILFSLDYNSQELRILASMLSEASPIRQWACNPNNKFAELLNIYKIDLSPDLWKGFMYSFLYGSNGSALAYQLSYDEVQNLGYYSKWKAARAIVSDFKAKVPEVTELRDHFTNVFFQDYAITAPGGFIRYVNPEEDLTKKETIKTNKARQIPLSHIIQGTGAYLARTIIAKSINMKYGRLHMPIHDGFVFYCKKNLFSEALQEAQNLLTSVARIIVPQVEMPHKIEWIRGLEQQA